ncbi:hypothetical protein thsrh120_24770 [Rhizobium sp. No.120]
MERAIQNLVDLVEEDEERGLRKLRLQACDIDRVAIGHQHDMRETRQHPAPFVGAIQAGCGRRSRKADINGT